MLFHLLSSPMKASAQCWTSLSLSSNAMATRWAWSSTLAISVCGRKITQIQERLCVLPCCRASRLPVFAEMFCSRQQMYTGTSGDPHKWEYNNASLELRGYTAWHLHFALKRPFAMCSSLAMASQGTIAPPGCIRPGQDAGQALRQI